MEIRGIQLRVGDTVLTEPDPYGHRQIDEVLHQYEGQCPQGIHFRTRRGSHVCYDKCAKLVLA